MSGTIEIPLTRGFVAIVDKADAPLVTGLKWHANKGTNTWYARSKHTMMHKLLTGTSKDSIVDHRNGNGLDNRRENLRVCSKAQNGMNTSKSSGTSSRFKGVTLRQGRWLAQIWKSKKRYHLGYHGTEEEAAMAYDAKALELFGSFAKLNLQGSN